MLFCIVVLGLGRTVSEWFVLLDADCALDVPKKKSTASASIHPYLVILFIFVFTLYDRRQKPLGKKSNITYCIIHV